MATTTTKKHESFITNPMGDNPITKVPGIGEVTAKNLRRKSGITKASELYGVYLRKPENFKEYILKHGGNARVQNSAFQAMKEYTEMHN